MSHCCGAKLSQSLIARCAAKQSAVLRPGARSSAGDAPAAPHADPGDGSRPGASAAGCMVRTSAKRPPTVPRLSPPPSLRARAMESGRDKLLFLYLAVSMHLLKHTRRHHGAVRRLVCLLPPCPPRVRWCTIPLPWCGPVPWAMPASVSSSSASSSSNVELNATPKVTASCRDETYRAPPGNLTPTHEVFRRRGHATLV